MSRLPAAERREQLLDAALEQFAEHGYARATTAQLAKAAGVTEPIIYRHFKSKRDLFVALIERTGKRTLEQWSGDLATATDPAERLKRLIGDNPMVSGDGRKAYRVFLQAITEVNDESIQAALEAHIKQARAFIQHELEAAQSASQVTHRFSAELLAKLLVHLGMGYGVLTAMQVPQHGEDDDGRHVQEIIARVLVGRRGRSEGESPA
ncbi:MAG: helix-turn-helix domain-containing protein [Planctomycetota bacterium]